MNAARGSSLVVGLAAALGIVAACRTFQDPPLDGGPDASPEGSASSGGPEGGPDAPTDAPIDAPPPPCGLVPLTTKVATLAGCDTAGDNDGVRGVGRFNNPTNVLLAPDGTTYVADFDNGILRALDPTGTSTTIIKQPTFNRPFGLAFAPGGNLYVETDDNDTNTGSHSDNFGTLWLVSPTAKTATVIARNLGVPRGLLVLADGRIVMSDYKHHVITILEPATANLAPLAGGIDQPGYVNDTGGAARFNEPYDMVLLPDGDIAIADSSNHRVRRVSLTGVVSDYAGSGVVGSDDGAAAAATFDKPQGLAIIAGSVYVTDVSRRVVRKIAGGAVTTVAGDGTADWADGPDPLKAKFFALEGIDGDATHLVIADGNFGATTSHHHVRILHLP